MALNTITTIRFVSVRDVTVCKNLPRIVELRRAFCAESMIKCPGTFQNALGTYRNAITHATLRRAPSLCAQRALQMAK